MHCGMATGSEKEINLKTKTEKHSVIPSKCIVGRTLLGEGNKSARKQKKRLKNQLYRCMAANF